MVMNWYIGQPIVAIRNHSQGFFRKGDEFVIRGLKQGCCPAVGVLINIGVTTDRTVTHCPACNFRKPVADHFFSEICFAPLDTNISELTEILERELVNV